MSRLKNRRNEFSKNNEVAKIKRLTQKFLDLSMLEIPRDLHEAVHQLFRANIPNFDKEF